MVEREKEKIESKGAYAYDLHEAIRDVRRAFAYDDLDRAGSCLNALRDICAPEIREAIQEEWLEIDRKYHNNLERVRNAEYKVWLRSWDHEGSWWEENKDGGITFNINVDSSHLSEDSKKGVVRRTRQGFLNDIRKEIFHERFRACVDCLDRHGELRKWRAVEYGKV